MSVYQVETVQVTITNGQQDSGVLTLYDRSLVGLILPATFDGAGLTLLVSQDGTTFVELDDPDTGAAVSLTVTASKAYAIDPILCIPWNFLKLHATTAQSTTDTVITAMVRRVA